MPKVKHQDIINDDGTLHQYAQFGNPDHPEDPENRIQVNEYTAKYNMALKKRDDYKSDRLTVASIIHSHVGTESRARVIEENLSLAPGDTKDLDDPLDYLRLLLTTHYKDARANSSRVRWCYESIHQYKYESRRNSNKFLSEMESSSTSLQISINKQRCRRTSSYSQDWNGS